MTRGEPRAPRALRARVLDTDRRHGKLDGAWRDCVIVERMLDEG